MAVDGYELADGALEREAGIWDGEAAQLRGVATMAGSLRFNREQAGLFQVLVDAHDHLAAVVAVRATEGGNETQRIAEALRATNRAYYEQEASTAYSFKVLHH
jgi:hypothetical protein